MKTLYQSLKPEYRKTLQGNENKFPSAVSSVRKSLENNFLWSRLTVQEVRDFMTFSDNRLFEEKMGWAPSQPLSEGMRKTYEWIKWQISKQIYAEV